MIVILMELEERNMVMPIRALSSEGIELQQLWVYLALTNYGWAINNVYLSWHWFRDRHFDAHQNNKELFMSHLQNLNIQNVFYQR